jgi:uncharacterized membrane protein
MVLGLGVLFIALAIPLILRRVPPNGFYGLRVPATFVDKWVWYEANARTGRDLAVLGVIELLLATHVPVLGDLEPRAKAQVLVVGVVLLAVIGWVRANWLLKVWRRRNSR